MDEFRSKLIVKKSIKKVLKRKAATYRPEKHKYDAVLAFNRNLTRWHFNQQLKKYD